MSKVWEVVIVAPNNIGPQIDNLNRWLVEDSARGALEYNVIPDLWHGEIKWLAWKQFADEFAKQEWECPAQTQLFIKGAVSAVRGFDEMDDRYVEVARGNEVLNFLLNK